MVILTAIMAGHEINFIRSTMGDLDIKEVIRQFSKISLETSSHNWCRWYAQGWVESLKLDILFDPYELVDPLQQSFLLGDIPPTALTALSVHDGTQQIYEYVKLRDIGLRLYKTELEKNLRPERYL